jgi:hypothetical protein
MGMEIRGATFAVRPPLAVALMATAFAAMTALTVHATYTATFTVNSNLDGTDATPNDGICQTATTNQCPPRRGGSR